MKWQTRLALGTALASLSSPALYAQTTADDSSVDDDTLPSNAIVVTGERLRGQLQVEQAPVLELNEEDIAAVGATSIQELLEAISPQTGSSRGRGGGAPPVLLLNGIRIGSFREMRSFPPEAIAKVEVMPEEVAQKFGYPPDRRVVNMILKENFASNEIELEFEGPDRGGYNAFEQEATLLRIKDGGRFNVNISANEVTALTEGERDVLQAEGTQSDIAGDPDPADYRTLVPRSFEFELTGNWAKALMDSGSSLSLNATYEHSDSTSLSGLNSVILTDPNNAQAFRTFGANDPLERRSSSDSFSAAASWSKPLGDFQMTVTSDAVYTDSKTKIDRRADVTALQDAALAGDLALDGALPVDAENGYDISSSKIYTSVNKATLRGSLADLPAGELSATFDAGFDWKRIDSSDTRTLSDSSVTRRRLNSGVNVVVPIAEAGAAWGAIGDLSANFGAGFEDLSDFGMLYDWSAGLTWSPTDGLTLSGTYIAADSAPSISQLGNPVVETLNVPVYDFVNGETVLATVISGGNPDLVEESQRDWKFNATWELPFWESTSLSVDYIRNRSRNVSSSFPVLTAAIEQAFPDRVTRDNTGQLVQIDRRPVTFARGKAERLVFGLTTRGSFGKAKAAESEASARPAPAAAESAPEAGERRGPGFGAGGMPSEEQRAAFMRFRERVCADDGADMLMRLAEAVDRGDDLSVDFPGFDAERASQMVSRLRGEDGKIDPARVAQLRERLCSFDPSAMGRGATGGTNTAPAPSGGGAPSGGPGGGRGPMFGRGDDGRGRYFVNLSHTLELENTVLIAEGLPELDLLDGDATGETGQARHSTSLEVGIFRQGKGMRLSGRYTGKARIDGTGLPGSSDLFFSDLATLDLRVFADLGQVFNKDEGFLKNLRLSFRADNIFDGRRKVTDETGAVPISYQPFLIDPTGRYLGIDIRKMF